MSPLDSVPSARSAWCSIWLGLFTMLALWLGLPQTGRTQGALTNLWTIPTGVRTYVTTNYTERGIAYNRTTHHVLIASRNGGLKIAILDADTGNELGFLNTAGLTGGTFALNHIGVAEDGVIYAGNLATATQLYKLYRWVDEAAAPEVMFNGVPASPVTARFGDSLDVRGAGTNTQVLLGSDGVVASILTPTNDPITGFGANPISVNGIAAGNIRLGVTFGTNNTFFGKVNSQNLRLIQYNLATSNGTVIANYTVDSTVTAISYDPTNDVVAGAAIPTSSANHRVFLFNAAVSGTPPQLGVVNFPTPSFGNGNAVGAVDFGGGRVYAIDAGNGVIAATVTLPTVPVATGPGAQTVVRGGYLTLNANASGKLPLRFQWLFNGTNALPGQTNSFLNLTNITLEQAGEYSVTVSNSIGSVVSPSGVLTVTPAVLSSALTPLWKVQPGARAYINTDGTQRGLAYNTVSGHVLVASRSGSNGVHVLDAATGNHLWSLDTSGITGGTFALNLVAVDGQGRVYGCNLTTGAATDPFKLYRWESDAPDAIPALIFSGDPGDGNNQRWGDNLAVRFQDIETQVLVASRNGTLATIFQPDQGSHLVFNIPNIVAGGLGLGVAFGAGDTFWGKSSGNPLYEIAFEGATATAVAIRTNTTVSAMINIAVDPVRGGLAGNFLQTPDNVRLYEFGPGYLTELDTEFYATDNANPNGSGALAFGPNRLFALDANNGIVAYAVSPKLRWDWNGSTLTLSWDNPYVLQSAPAVTGTYTDVPNATSPYIVPNGPGNLFFRLRE